MNVLILHPNNSEAKISKGSSILIIHPNNLDCKISKVSNILIIHPNNLECKISKKSNILIIHPNNSKLQISKSQNILINLLGGGIFLSTADRCDLYRLHPWHIVSGKRLTCTGSIPDRYNLSRLHPCQIGSDLEVTCVGYTKRGRKFLVWAMSTISGNTKRRRKLSWGEYHGFWDLKNLGKSKNITFLVKTS